jgi:hypothetical protein
VTWNGGALVFDVGTHTGKRLAERTETWTLVAPDRLRISISSRSSSAGPQTLTSVYRRR